LQASTIFDSERGGSAALKARENPAEAKADSRASGPANRTTGAAAIVVWEELIVGVGGGGWGKNGEGQTTQLDGKVVSNSFR
jgi:hypothetical protein